MRLKILLTRSYPYNRCVRTALAAKIWDNLVIRDVTTSVNCAYYRVNHEMFYDRRR